MNTNMTTLVEMWNKKDSLKKVCLCAPEKKDLDYDAQIEYLGWSKCKSCKGYSDLKSMLRGFKWHKNKGRK